MTPNSGCPKHQLLFRERFRTATPMILFVALYTALCAFNFGYDVGNFGGVQAMQPFAKKFGSLDPKTGLYFLPNHLSSVMTATPFFGKLIGALACGPVCERWGRRAALAVLACISVVGVTLQTSATTTVQFTIGRIVNFAMTGFCIIVVPVYQAECTPPQLRGLTTSVIQMMIIVGQLVASLINLGTKPIPSDAAWRIPVGLQLVTPAVLLLLWPLVPESPRWLLARNREDEARRSLHVLQSGRLSEGELARALRTLRESLKDTQKGPWREVFGKRNRLRTFIAVTAMVGQQITGQAFVSQYAAVFYLRNGFASQALLLTMISNLTGLAGTVLAWTVVDGFGRRPILLIGGFFMGAFLYIVGAISAIHSPSNDARNMLVASISLFNMAYNMSWAPVSYIVLGEVANTRVREKTSLLACSLSIVVTFLTSFTMPYLIDTTHAGLSGRVGFVYGSLCFAANVVAYFFVPEMKGRTLEEIDALFEARVPLRRFRDTVVPSASEASDPSSDPDERGTRKSEPAAAVA
ncbi:hypothetical protein V2A60_009747 [Cordyceps javanica]|uniref:Sugar transport protein n=1 Tax=Cordyceps javanica TaxID=43265 RepID=A0A545VV50_9HYPO|nr:sugar transport protein [Cordyceps javanica]TQW05602.1 sugar transport protein [Cordyceps javanica]